MIKNTGIITGKRILLFGAVVFCINMIVAGILFVDRIGSEKGHIITTGTKLQLIFRNEILSRENTIEILRSAAESYLEDKTTLNASLLEQIRPYPEKRGYIMTDLAGYEPVELGTLTGLGPVPQRGTVLLKEIYMAISLSPVFKALMNNNPDTPWVYYTSYNNFIYIYPPIVPEDFFFSDRLLSKDFIKSALPENNPEKEIFWSPIYLDEAGKGLMTTLSAPLYLKDSFLGSVSIDVHVNKLNWLLQSYKQKDSTNHLVNSKGEDILTPGKSFAGISPGRMTPGVLYPYKKGWISVYEMDIENWYILIETDKKSIYRDTLKKTLPVFFIAFLLLITLTLVFLLFKAWKKVETLSTKDPLTGSLNRFVFDNIARQNFASTKRENTAFGLISIDIDYFKKFNDTYGHLKGDQALKAVTRVLRNTLTRETDYFFRVGGEEFAVITLSNTESQLSLLLEKLRDAVYSLKMPHEASPMGRVSISLGGYIVNREFNDSFHDAFEKSDMALYQAKSQGRNCYRIFRD